MQFMMPDMLRKCMSGILYFPYFKKEINSYKTSNMLKYFFTYLCWHLLIFIALDPESSSSSAWFLWITRKACIVFANCCYQQSHVQRRAQVH